MTELSATQIAKIKEITQRDFHRVIAMETPDGASEDKYKRKILREEIGKRFKGELILNNTHLVGVGAESVVVTNADKKKALAFEYEDSAIYPLEMSTIYHVHRLLYLLFPHNFPRFYSAGSNIGKFSVRELITTTTTETETKYPFAEVYEVLDALRIPIGFDPNSSNFETSIQGGEYYLDKARIDFDRWDKINPEAIARYLNQNNFSEHTIGLISRTLSRLRVLCAARAVISEIEYIHHSDLATFPTPEALYQFRLDKALKRHRQNPLSSVELKATTKMITAFEKTVPDVRALEKSGLKITLELLKNQL